VLCSKTTKTATFALLLALRPSPSSATSRRSHKVLSHLGALNDPGLFIRRGRMAWELKLQLNLSVISDIAFGAYLHGTFSLPRSFALSLKNIIFFISLRVNGVQRWILDSDRKFSVKPRVKCLIRKAFNITRQSGRVERRGAT
jgi:hypothetical protein